MNARLRAGGATGVLGAVVVVYALVTSRWPFLVGGIVVLALGLLVAFSTRFRLRLSKDTIELSGEFPEVDRTPTVPERPAGRQPPRSRRSDGD